MVPPDRPAAGVIFFVDLLDVCIFENTKMCQDPEIPVFFGALLDYLIISIVHVRMIMRVRIFVSAEVMMKMSSCLQINNVYTLKKYTAVPRDSRYTDGRSYMYTEILY